MSQNNNKLRVSNSSRIILLTIVWIIIYNTYAANIVSEDVLQDCTVTPCRFVSNIDVKFEGIPLDALIIELKDVENGKDQGTIVLQVIYAYQKGDLDLLYICKDPIDINYDLVCDCPGGSTLCPRSNCGNQTCVYYDKISTSKGCTFDWYESSVRTCGNINFHTKDITVYTEDFKDSRSDVIMYMSYYDTGRKPQIYQDRYFYYSNYNAIYSMVNDVVTLENEICNNITCREAGGTCDINAPFSVCQAYKDKYNFQFDLLTKITSKHSLKGLSYIAHSDKYYQLETSALNQRTESDPYKACFINHLEPVPASIINALNINIEQCTPIKFNANENLGSLSKMLVPSNEIELGINTITNEYTILSNMNPFLVNLKLNHFDIDFQKPISKAIITKTMCSEFNTGKIPKCEICGRSLNQNNAICKAVIYADGTIVSINPVEFSSSESCNQFEGTSSSKNLTICLKCDNENICRNITQVILTDPPVRLFLPTTINNNPNSANPTKEPHVTWWNSLNWWQKMLFIVGMIAAGILVLYLFIFCFVPVLSTWMKSCFTMMSKEWEHRAELRRKIKETEQKHNKEYNKLNKALKEDDESPVELEEF